MGWEDCGYPEQELIFETRDGGLDHPAGEPCADAFLSACFPLAAVHGEARVRIEGQPCPMLVEASILLTLGGKVGVGHQGCPPSKLPVASSAVDSPAISGALHFSRGVLTAFIC